MTWSNRLRLGLGIIAVIALAAVLTFHLNAEKGLAKSSTATITSEHYNVASPYSGLVTKAFVKKHDTVKAGDPLFVIDSPALRNELAADMEPTSTAASTINRNGTVAVKATADGLVTDVEAVDGTFVQGAVTLAKVDRAGTLKVEADFTLTPNEYARVEDKAPVTIVLPNDKRLNGTVETVDVKTKNGNAEAVITVASKELKLGAENGLVATGTPVTAELHLRNDGVVSTVANNVKDFFRGIF
jgi:multidrug resistance efflux pump